MAADDGSANAFLDRGRHRTRRGCRSFLTTLAKLLFHHGTGGDNQPVAIMEAVNNDFRSIFGARSFMTAMCVALDPSTGRASVVGAGHPPLLVARSGGRTESIPSIGATAGLLERSEFRRNECRSGSGRRISSLHRRIYGSGHEENPRLVPRTGSRESSRAAGRRTRRHLLDRSRRSGGDSERWPEPPPDDVAAVAVRRSQ